jgi:hypothetical protein
LHVVLKRFRISGVLLERHVNRKVAEMSSRRRLPGVLLRNLLALGQSPAEDVSIW